MKWVLCFIFLLTVPLVRAQADPFHSNGVFISQSGAELTVQCENISLGVVLQTLAEHLHINLLLTEPLEQPVSLNVRGVNHHEIMNSLIGAYSLDYSNKNQILVISPVATSIEKKSSKIFRLKYANAEQLAETLKGRLSVSFDSRTNAIVVYDAEEVLLWLESLIEEIDIPAKQVYIEATILNASAQFSKELGLRFSVNEFSIANFPKDIPLNVAIAAAQENHQTTVIANPKLLTINLQEAHIKQGKQLAYQETSASGATSLTFQEAALELKVTPMITPENDILLDLLVKQDVIGSTAINGQPTIDTKSIQAKIRVKDGETIVLGGIYSQTDNTQSREVPGLSKIPMIGKLFQEKRDSDDQDELLIFVTPRVVL